ncbi:MAG TPA: class I SAM-dependent RNA methyltransferase [Kiritimatiellia bacterium]|nr:class I SAM-dependent RNA methyltransferase [Kiritimatiellia bacterium]HMO98944.1 class I SAM-dependent RNA methyltransferase [Kiritimatiellia bacterium]HMP95723.1 class I SAM-dependent RNA methyltransferase [Kiritimatiellia bacterium]
MTHNISSTNRDSLERNLIIITTAKGMAPMLAGEVEALGLKVCGSTETGVSVQGAMTDAMRLNLNVRTAHRVLWKLGDGPAKHPNELYKRLVGWPWERWVPPQGLVSITVSGKSVSGDDPRFVALKTKDALMDRMSQVNGFRPDSGPERNKTVVHVHWEGRFFDAYLDTSGEPLSHRGYRHQPGNAPMRETLAAACLIGAGWDAATTLVNPMCGSGTLAIEAALLASHTPPGFLRDNFGFMHLNDYRAADWQTLRREAAKNRLIRPRRVAIFASDLDPRAVEAARANARRAGVADWIEFSVGDFRETKLPDPPGLIIFNPEYGERLAANPDLAAHYKDIGDFMKHKAQGFTGAVFTGNAEMIKPIGLKPRTKLQLFNGPIEGRLLVFDLYAGTKRDRRLRD